MAVKYACCKRGPRHQLPSCMFANFLRDLDLPARIGPRLWKDLSHLPSGPSGIDIFFGQEYTVEQMDRIYCMIANEGPERIPEWARQLTWFLGEGSSGKYIHDGDFGWRARFYRAHHG